MSILINLLPDIRQAKLRERRRRQVASGISVLVWAICGGVVVLLSVYAAGQKVIISNFTKSINDNEQQLRNVTGLVDALTAEQHAASLPGLYGRRVYMTKFFQAYVDANPADVALSSMSIDSTNTLLVNGTGKTYAVVAKLARTLEASNVKVGANASDANAPYFSNVSITSVSAGSKGVNFTLNATLDAGVTSGN